MNFSPEFLVTMMIVGFVCGLAFGFPVPFVMLGISLIIGIMGAGIGFFDMMVIRLFETMQNYILVSIILFVYMGNMLDTSGMGDRLFKTAHILLGGVPGGLALAVVVVCTIMAASTGIIGAPVMIMGMVALPVMLQSGYDRALSCGVISAGGCLGIIIPPSIMLVVYGPMAGLSVGKLFMAAFLPGLVLSALYAVYVIVRCWSNPELGPPLPASERTMPLSKKLSLAASSMFPPLLLIGAVLGSMFMGVASPTEASALGAVAGLFLTFLYGKLTWKVFTGSVYGTLRSSCMILVIVAAAYVFTGTFMMVGGGEIVQGFLLDLPFGKWGVLLVMCFAFFICGFFMEWPGILPILVPIFTPVLKTLDFDPLWAAIVFCVVMQTSFLTPPMAPALFYLKGVAPKEIRFVQDICGGAIPFLILQCIGVAMTIFFPALALWLPSVMIK